jgi:predicted phage terminase large subunit-like protein
LPTAASPAVLEALPLAAAALRRRRATEDASPRWVPRDNQRTPLGEWYVWLILAGRGWGKTRTGAEDLGAYALEHSGARLAVVAPTYADARDTCIEGESGLLRVLPPAKVQAWNRSLGELVLTNGSRVKLFSADEPDRLRGPQHHRAWCDELAAWKYPETFDQLLFGLRLGHDPRVVVTTTPKPVRLIRELLARADVQVTRGSTFENAENLAPAALAQLKDRYEGTRLGRQELYADVLDDVPGALWQRKAIDDTRLQTAPDLERVVVAIDPAVTSGEDSDETGIVVAGRGVDGRGYVLADRTCRLSPDGWAKRACAAYDQFHADRIIAEVNNGGDLVERVIRTVGASYPYRAVRASRGKLTRAEPIAALYEQGRISHVGSFPDMEDQMCTYTPDGYDGSPDRVDALVWALTELMLTETGVWAV